MLNLLLRMQEQLGLTIILISHDIRVVGYMSHELGVHREIGPHGRAGARRRGAAQSRCTSIRVRCSTLHPALVGWMRGAEEAAFRDRASTGLTMARSIAVAILRMVVTVFLAVTFVFVILRVSGDPIRALLPLDAPEELVEATAGGMGLDQPVYVQFVAYVSHLLQGDLAAP